MTTQPLPQMIPAILVDDRQGLESCIQAIADAATPGPSTLYLDLEGINLSRHGSVSLLTLLIHENGIQDRVYLIDIHTLGASAFTTPSNTGSWSQSLKHILESRLPKKALFDVRNDSDALFSHFGIKMKGVIDLQLMENVARRGGKRLLHGLGRCIQNDSGLSDTEKVVWETSKNKGKQLFAPEKGGRYEIFNERPLHEYIKAYCEHDVRLLPLLHDVYTERLRSKPNHDLWESKIKVETKRRLEESMKDSYEPNGKDKALAPEWEEVPGDSDSDGEGLNRY